MVVEDEKSQETLIQNINPHPLDPLTDSDNYIIPNTNMPYQQNSSKCRVYAMCRVSHPY